MDEPRLQPADGETAMRQMMLPKTMITIDGSSGEGGGQVLRMALAMSLTTGPAVPHRQHSRGPKTAGTAAPASDCGAGGNRSRRRPRRGRCARVERAHLHAAIGQ